MKSKHKQDKKTALAKAIFGRKPVWHISTELFDRKNNLFRTVRLPCLFGQYSFSDYMIPHLYLATASHKQKNDISMMWIRNQYDSINHVIHYSSLLMALKQFSYKHQTLTKNKLSHVSNRAYGDHHQPKTLSQQSQKGEITRVEKIGKHFFIDFIHNKSTPNNVSRLHNNRFMYAIKNQYFKAIESNFFKPGVSINPKSIKQKQESKKSRAIALGFEPQAEVQVQQTMTSPFIQHNDFDKCRFITDRKIKTSIEALMTKETVVQQEIQSQLLQINQSFQDKQQSQSKMIKEIQQSLTAITKAMLQQPSAQPATFRPTSFYGRFK